MRDAFAPLEAKGACLFVLTLDRMGTYSGEKRWENAQAAYRALSALSNEFLKRLRKWMRSQGWRVLKNEWVATVEMHKSGWPHVNFVIWHPELADWIANEKRERLADGLSERDSTMVSRELADIVTGSGWGLISTAERARSRDETLGYICKLAGKVDESIGELSKLTQLPTNAPFRFRRLRSGKGFLPKRNKQDHVTGTLIRRNVWGDGSFDAIPLHEVKGGAIPFSEKACYTEDRIWKAELEARFRCARQYKKWGRNAICVPAVTHWKDFRRLDKSPSLRGRPANDVSGGYNERKQE
jgi:hypothetical protein